MMVNPNVAAGTQEEETMAAAQHLSSAETALSTDSSLAGQGHSLWGASASGQFYKHLLLIRCISNFIFNILSIGKF